MPYEELEIPVQRRETRITGATCDGCGEKLVKTSFGWSPALVLTVSGGLCALWRPSDMGSLRLTYCYTCAHKVIEAVPNLKSSLMGEIEGE